MSVQMSGENITILTRTAKGAPLTSEEMDANLLALQSAVNLSVPIGFKMEWDAVDQKITLNTDQSSVQDVNLFESIGAGDLNLGSVQGSVHALNQLVIDKTQGAGSPFIINSNGVEVFSVGADGNVSINGGLQLGELILTVRETQPGPSLGSIYTNGDDLFVCVNE